MMNTNDEILDEFKTDYQTYKKISGTLSPDEKANLTITSDRPKTTVTEIDVIEPQDQATIKYLSNIKDNKTNEISKPFFIKNKKYQMVRGIDPNNKIIIGVYCFDELHENGENKIYPVDTFEQNFTKELKKPKDNVTNIIDHLNLIDINPQYKHFFVNTKTGDIIACFKNTKEMVTSGIKLNQDEDYMDIKALKKFRFINKLKPELNELDSPTDGTNIPKLQSDVKKLATLIKNKFSVYLSKLDKPIEQAQFLTAMANEIGVPLNKLSSIINTYKEIANSDTSTK